MTGAADHASIPLNPRLSIGHALQARNERPVAPLCEERKVHATWKPVPTWEGWPALRNAINHNCVLSGFLQAHYVQSPPSLRDVNTGVGMWGRTSTAVTMTPARASCAESEAKLEPRDRTRRSASTAARTPLVPPAWPLKHPPPSNSAAPACRRPRGRRCWRPIACPASW